MQVQRRVLMQAAEERCTRGSLRVLTAAELVAFAESVAANLSFVKQLHKNQVADRTQQVQKYPQHHLEQRHKLKPARKKQQKQELELASLKHL